MSSILVFVACYNGEKYLREQLDSILNQKTNHDVYLYIRDDHSKDSTPDILKEYKDKYSNVEIELGENVGVNQCFLGMLKHA